jgi:hypothetical protein
MNRPVAISKVKGALQHTDGVVVSLLTPVMTVRDGNEPRVSDVGENQVAEMRAPNAIEDLSIRPDRCGRHIVAPQPRLAVRKVCIEDVTT